MLTLVGTPVIYSLFDDVANSELWAKVSRRFSLSNETRATAALAEE